MDITTLLLFFLGLGFLIIGAELLVRGSSKLAAAIGISPLVIGLTVVAFGTSSPELAVSVQSATAGQGDLAVGNIIGSNIFNVLFILGLSALIAPLVVSQQLIRLDVPLMIIASCVMVVFGLDHQFSRVEGLLLFGGIVGYTVWSIRQSRKEQHVEQARKKEPSEITHAKTSTILLLNSITALVGLALLVLGSEWLVDGAVTFARLFGVSELIIGLTIIAGGTSMPEVATSVIASLRGERDIAVGNVVGSNIFNILAVLGLSSIVAPSGISLAPAALHFDLPVMVAVAIACLPIFFHEGSISRWEGGLFLAYYIAYTMYLVLDATGHDYLPYFSAVMVGFVLPLTLITLVVVVVRFVKKQRMQ